MIYPLDGRNTEKPKTEMLSFYQQQSYLRKSQNINIFFMKKSKNNNIILGFSFQFLVLRIWFYFIQWIRHKEHFSMTQYIHFILLLQIFVSSVQRHPKLALLQKREISAFLDNVIRIFQILSFTNCFNLSNCVQGLYTQ